MLASSKGYTFIYTFVAPCTCGLFKKMWFTTSQLPSCLVVVLRPTVIKMLGTEDLPGLHCLEDICFTNTKSMCLLLLFLGFGFDQSRYNHSCCFSSKKHTFLRKLPPWSKPAYLLTMYCLYLFFYLLLGTTHSVMRTVVHTVHAVQYICTYCTYCT